MEFRCSICMSPMDFIVYDDVSIMGKKGIKVVPCRKCIRLVLDETIKNLEKKMDQQYVELTKSEPEGGE